MALRQLGDAERFPDGVHGSCSTLLANDGQVSGIADVACLRELPELLELNFAQRGENLFYSLAHLTFGRSEVG